MPLFRFQCNTPEQASPLSTLGPPRPTLASTHRHCRNPKPKKSRIQLFVPTRAHPHFPVHILLLTSKQKVTTNHSSRRELFMLSCAPNFPLKPSSSQTAWISGGPVPQYECNSTFTTCWSTPTSLNDSLSKRYANLFQGKQFHSLHSLYFLLRNLKHWPGDEQTASKPGSPS